MSRPAEFSVRTRARSLQELPAKQFDVVVIGGGITGAGVARDACLRGLSVALVERRDFASGTSSRSSKLIHGGLRYLQQGDVGLVRDGGLVYTRDSWLGQRWLGDIVGTSTVDVRSIGAGGGSIAWVDDFGKLHVGPHSAGARPGPAAYGRGGISATTTDANLALGLPETTGLPIAGVAP